MNRSSRSSTTLELPKPVAPDEVIEWPSGHCDVEETPSWSAGPFSFSSLGRVGIIGSVPSKYADNWADSVPKLVDNLASLLTEKKRQEIIFNLLKITLDEFEARIHRLESIQTKIMPIDSFAPEPYGVLKTILASVHSVEGGFNAGWFDANIHTSGDNEEEAVSNLKSLILDFFDRFSDEPAGRLGPEPTRQLAVLKEHIQKKP